MKMLDFVVCSKCGVLFDLESVASPSFVVLVGPVFEIVAGFFWDRNAGIFMRAEALGIICFDAIVFAAIRLDGERVINLIPEGL